MGADEYALAGGSAFYVFPVLEQAGQRRRRLESLDYLRQGEDQREVQCRIDADQIVRVAGEAPGVLRDLLLAVGDFPEGEEVLLADAQREFPDGVAEGTGELSFDMFQRVDAVPVDVELGDDVLVGGDEHVAGGELEAAVRCHLAEVGGDLLQRAEVADHAERRSLAAEETVVPEFVREHRCFFGQLRVTLQILRRHLPLLLGRAVGFPPADRVRKTLERGLRSESLIFEHVARVIDDDVQDHVDAAGVGFVDEILQVLFAAEARVDLQQVLETVAVICGVLPDRVLEHRGDPDRAGAQRFYVSQPLADAPQGAALEAAELGIKRQVLRRARRVVETIDHQEVDPLIAPVRWRREGLDDFYAVDIFRAWDAGLFEGIFHALITKRRSHGSPSLDWPG